MPYLFHFLLFVLIYYIFKYDIKKSTKGYLRTFKCFYILLAVLVAFRYGVGVDTSNYMAAYNEVPPIDELELEDFIRFRFQPFYLIINSICKSFTDNFVLLQIIQSYLFYHSLYILLRKLNLRKFYILFIFYTYMYFSSGMAAMRESFALAFCMYGLNYYLCSKWIKYYILIFIGFLFHTGAIVFFIVPFFKIFTKKTLKSYIFFISCCCIAFSFLSILQNILGNIISDGSISRYSLSGNGSINIVNTFRNIVILWIIYRFCIKSTKAANIYSMDIILLGTTYVIMDLFSGSFLPILFRFSSHFFIFFCCCTKIIIDSINGKKIFSYIIIFFLFYQPIARCQGLFNKESRKFFYYSSIFSFDKSHNKKIIDSAEAGDYILY